MASGLIVSVCFKNSRYLVSTNQRHAIVGNYVLLTSSVRGKASSATAVVGQGAAGSNQTSPKEPLDLTFSNTKEAYKSKTSAELIRTLFVLKLSSYDFLIENHPRVSAL